MMDSYENKLSDLSRAGFYVAVISADMYSYCV